jgi:hypothetical protein
MFVTGQFIILSVPQTPHFKESCSVGGAYRHGERRVSSLSIIATEGDQGQTTSRGLDELLASYNLVLALNAYLGCRNDINSFGGLRNWGCLANGKSIVWVDD